MKNYRGSSQKRRDLFVIADIRKLKIDRVPHFVQVGLAPGQQVVNDDDAPRALAQQAAHNRRTDETRAARDYIVIPHAETPVYDAA
jgi:hypothetical protein